MGFSSTNLPANSPGLAGLVQAGESDQLEFKRKVNHPEKILREIVAFANTNGGVLLIGVDDDKNILGVNDAQEEVETLEKSLSDLVAPRISHKVEILKLNHRKSIIMYQISESKRKPHYLNPSPLSKRGQVYYRYQDRSIQASPELVKIIKGRTRSREGTLIRYGQDESLIIKLLSESQVPLKLQTVVERSGLSPKTTSEALIKLVLANIVMIYPKDGSDEFSIKDSVDNY